MGRLLITTFQKPGRNFEEARLFKQGAMASRLLTLDRANELWPLHAELQHTDKQRGIREMGSGSGDRVLAFFHLSETMGKGWSRLTKLESQRFHTFLRALYGEAVDCWVIGAHHHHKHPRYSAMNWGTEFEPADGDYRPYTGQGIDATTGQLEWFGYRHAADVPKEIVIPSATAALRSVSLMVIMGCNGVPRKINNTSHFAEMAMAWRRLTRPALILGWFGVHGLPLDAFRRHAANRFWFKMAALKAQHAIPDGGLRTLVANHSDDVIQAWGQACYEGFHKKEQPNLWRQELKNGDARGAGAIRQDGVVFHANPQYPNPNPNALVRVPGLVVP